jgi:ribonuclease HII
MVFERGYAKTGEFVIACDEVGRGPIAGPVVGCSVIIKMQEEDDLIKKLESLGVTDSKKLSTKKRLNILKALDIDIDELDADKTYQKMLEGNKFGFSLFELGPKEIDQMNILQASLACMKFGVQTLLYQFHVYADQCQILVDGNQRFSFDDQFDYPDDAIHTITKGDSKSSLIALASIIAKEYRDNKMKALDLVYPGYGLANHAGYPTAEHKKAIEKLGITPIHRLTFKGVKEFV